MPATSQLKTLGEWSVRSASSNFSKVFSAALTAPQLITRRKEDRVVVVSESLIAEHLSAPDDLFGAVCSMKSVPGLDQALQPRKPYKRRDLNL